MSVKQTVTEHDSSSPSPSQPEIRVLVVEDDDAMLRAVVAGLVARGYRAIGARSAKEAFAACEDAPPDVVLLDLGLPDVDGIEVCRHLRRWTANPIIVLTADGAEDRKVLALDTGADDYVTKPFSMPELHARVRVALRHRAALASIVADDDLRVGSLHIDLAAHTVTVGDALVDLGRREYDLLVLFARNCGKVLTAKYILTQVWGAEWVDHAPTLRRHVATLRKKLPEGADAPRIETESGIGYRMLRAE
jgi:two-component system KDP operon response regulator KdpE